MPRLGPLGFARERQRHPSRGRIVGDLSEFETGQWPCPRGRVKVELSPCPQRRPGPCRLLKPLPHRVLVRSKGYFLPARQREIQFRSEGRFERSHQEKFPSEDSLRYVAWICGGRRDSHPARHFRLHDR